MAISTNQFRSGSKANTLFADEGWIYFIPSGLFGGWLYSVVSPA